MRKFKYTARNQEGKEVKGVLEARDSAAVTDVLHDRGLIVVDVREEMKFDMERLNEINIGGVPMQDKVVFMRQLSTMISAGLSLTKALEILKQQATNPYFQRVLADVLESVQSGVGLADSFRNQSEDVFDDVTLNLVQAGEESGNLDTILERLATELEEQKSMGAKIRSAMIYPAIILIIIVAVVVIMMLVLVPSMTEIYGEFGAELPWATQFLISASDFLLAYWWVILTFLIVLVVGGKMFLDTPKGKNIWDKIILKIPAIGKIITKMQLSNFTRILALLLSSGLSIIQALELTSNSLSNTVFKNTVLQAKKEVEKGGTLAVPIARSEYFPLIVSQMIAVGEETGEIDSVLEKVSEYYKEEVDNATDNLSSLLEPIMLILMGGAIGFIALAIYMPMFQLSEVMSMSIDIVNTLV
jgi:type IV pilus assembly protein PilC